jgi:hypothetical protein
MPTNSLLYKKIFLLFSLLGVMSYATYPQPIAGNFKKSCNNFLYIRGTSNVNEFSFNYIEEQQFNNVGATSQGSQVELSIPIKQFHASNPMMYKDFLELMKESEHPNIKIAFSKSQLTMAVQRISEDCPEISITIAGITRVYKVQCNIARCGEQYYLSGEQSIKLSDFQLKPPQKLMGMVKVNNKIDVDFGFIITFTNNNQISAIL